MSGSGKTAGGSILAVRLGAMGDIIHALPAVASLKHSYPGWRLTWVVEPRWTALLAGNPFVDRVVALRREALIESRRDLCADRYDFAVDFQGLLKSALVASLARPRRIFGFHQTQTRERAAGLFYSDKTASRSVHVVDRNLDLAAAAGAGSVLKKFPIPQGEAEGDLPEGDFVLASPLAGWRSKQWPLESYRTLAARMREELGIPLVLNGPPGSGFAHISGLPGLIHATRRAAAVVGVDSGPMHLAAALGKPGVAIFGPTDPARNGPYGDSLQVLRSSSAVPDYKCGGERGAYRRGKAIDESMRAVSPDAVFEVLKSVLCSSSPSAMRTR
jgi:heptosyltransferase I